ncbi:MAG TPA: hypothetical protein VG672_11805 [Bryobacteraceae bacterium]|nr:hypothetical protein [Bryobacteraceae bacterium]
MNLYKYVEKPSGALVLDPLRFWSTAYRPLGAWFYVPIYRIFGLNSLPYRLVCFALLGCNLLLLYRLILGLTGLREVALVATFLGSYHAWFIDLYYSAGTIYELLCYGLYLGALLLYMRARSRGRALTGWELAGVAGLYVLALDAKEMAVSFPVVLAAYECLFPGRPGRTWLARVTRDAPAVWITAAITAVYIAGKLTGPDSLALVPSYTPHFSAGRYLDTFHLYLNPLFYQENRFHDSNTVQLVLAMLLLGLWRRSRVLLLAWWWLLVTLLPVAFIGHYAAFFEYLPCVGWVLYLASALVAIRRWLVGLARASPMWVRVSQALLMTGLAAFVAPQHIRETRRTLALYQSVQPPSREVVDVLTNLQPKLRRGGKVLFVDDPCPRDSYFLVFVTRLFYDDLTVQVDRAKITPVPPAEYRRYDSIFRFGDGGLKRLTRRGEP